MSTFYLDGEGGNDANDGTSFANRWKTITSGATAARIAPGDTIRVMGSPAPTSLGINGTWTDGPLPATKSIESSTNASPIVVTITGHGYSNGDTVIVNGHTTNTKANGVWEVANVAANTFELSGSTGNGVGGATGTVRKINNVRVTLASALTLTIASTGNAGNGRTAWTASANVTATLNTSDFKEGDSSDSLAIAGGFVTGLAAYKALSGSTDYSGYKQVSFWIKQTAGTVAVAGDVSLRLCSDAVGAVSVNTIAIPALVALNNWTVFTVDTGGALGAAIQSVALYVDTDRGAQTFLISNIIAVKDSTSADSISLTSLIGKNSGTEWWYGIQSINGTRVVLDGSFGVIPGASPSRGYTGTSETVTTYKRETIKVAIVASGSDAQAVQDSGSSGSLIAFEGGYDRTNMTTQNLETWFDGSNGRGNGITLSSKTFVRLNLIRLVRYTQGFNLSSSDDITLGDVGTSNTTTGIVISTSNRCAITTASCVNGGSGISVTSSGGCVFTTLNDLNNCSSTGLVCNASGNTITTIGSVSNNGTNGAAVTGQWNRIGTITKASGNGSDGVNFLVGSSQSSYNSVTTLTAANSNGAFGVNFVSSSECAVMGGASASNGTSGIGCTTGTGYLRNFTVNESTEVSGQTAYANSKVFSEKHDGTADNHQIFCDGGLISSTTAQRHTASDFAWAMQPTSANRSAAYPLTLSIARVACAASAAVTATIWMRRTNTGLTMRFVCKGGQIGGVASDQVASMSASADTWEQLTISFTPSEAGVVEITAEAYGGTTYTGYVDDFAVSQA